MEGILAHFRAARKPKDVPTPVTLGLIVLSLVLRWVELDHLPGVSGDEALSAAQILRWFRSEPYTWITPTGRPYCPFYLLPLIALLKLFGPSAWVFRLPSLLAGISIPLLAWPLLGRILPAPKARIATLWIACLPIHLAYSRLAGEPVFIPLSALWVTYFALRSDRWGVAISMVAALLVHSVAIFLLPIAIAPLIYDAARAGKLPRARWWIVGGAVGLLAAGLLWKSVPSTLHRPPFKPSDPTFFWLGLTRLFSGVLAFGSFSAKLGSTWTAALDAILTLGLGTLLFRARRLLPRDRAFALGVFVSLAALFLIGGLTPFAIGSERYSLYLTLPVLVLLAQLWPDGPKAQVAALLIACAMLASFAAFYAAPMLRDGGSRFEGYRAGGPTDPKIAASQWLTADVGSAQSMKIVADNWWVYWVVADYALVQTRGPIILRHTDVGPDLPSQDRIPNAAELEAFLGADGYAVTFSGSMLDRMMRELDDRTHRWESRGFADYSGAEFVTAWKPCTEFRNETAAKAPAPALPE